MADDLYPPRQRGSLRLLGYGVRDVRGVEPPDADPSDRSGFNEEAEWTERCERSRRREHAETGEHIGPKFPFCVLIIAENQSNLFIGGGSYRVEPTGGHVLHSEESIATITATGAGHAEIQLAKAPFGNVYAEAACPGWLVSVEDMGGGLLAVTSVDESADIGTPEWSFQTVLRLYTW